MRKKALVSWSSGKDSAWTLHVLRQSNEYEIVGLLTTINGNFDRVAMHGVRRELVEAQAAAVKVPLWEVPLPWPCSNQEYEAAMSAACAKAIDAGVQAVAFGDLFLEDVRQYREDRMRGIGLAPVFPLWKIDTLQLIHDMWAGGLRSRIVCLDPKKVPASFAGRDLDQQVLDEFPRGIDPCGENGEFHTFVYDGPMFAQAIAVQSGVTVTRDGFVFTDLCLCEPADEAVEAKVGTQPRAYDEEYRRLIIP
ncbi:MAG: ATP-binding protein [Candidatus Sulfotelmatobacter sp.]